MNIFEKLSAITNELSTIAKNFTVGDGKFSYKAVKEGDVLSAIKPLEAKYKVFSYPIDRKVIYQDIISFENSSGQSSTKVFMRIETTYRFVDMEKPTDYVDIKSYGDGVDTQDKACGKAMTYSDKYALLKVYKIETGDDPDKDMSETIVRKQERMPTSDKDLEYARNVTLKYGDNAGKKLGELTQREISLLANGSNEYLRKHATTILKAMDEGKINFEQEEITEEAPF